MRTTRPERLMGTSLKLTVSASTLTCALCAGGWFLRATICAHPRCRPAARRAAAAAPASAAPAVAGPSLETACAANTPVLRHVPKAARAVWAQCLSQVASTNATFMAWGAFMAGVFCFSGSKNADADVVDIWFATSVFVCHCSVLKCAS